MRSQLTPDIFVGDDSAGVGVAQTFLDEAGLVFLNGQVVVNGFIEYEGAVALLGVGQGVNLLELGRRGPETDGLHVNSGHNTKNDSKICEHTAKHAVPLERTGAGARAKLKSLLSE